MIAQFWSICLFAMLSLLVGCAEPRRSSPKSFEQLAAAEREWRYHPDIGKLAVTLELSPGVFVAAGHDGQRTLVDERTDSIEAAVHLAPEDLVGILHLDERWAYIGRSGTSYVSEHALGDFVEVRSPPQPLDGLYAAGSSIVAIGIDGNLVRSGDAGRSWKVVGPPRNPTRRFVAVALAPMGRGVALAVPEEIWHTRDGGSTWSRVGADPIGASQLVPGTHGALIGAAGGAFYSLLPSGKLIGASPNAFPRGVATSEGMPRPNAVALQQGRAGYFADGEYFEFGGRGGTIYAPRGARGKPMKGYAIAGVGSGFGSCARRKVAVFEVAHVACAEQRSGEIAWIEIYRSDDKGRSFTKEPYRLRARSAPPYQYLGSDYDTRSFDLTMVAGADGALIVTGACESLSCVRPRVLYRQASGKLADATLPKIHGGLRGLVFSRDGRRAYALAVAPSQDRYWVLVSDDRGRTFRVRHDYSLEREQADSLKVLWAAPGTDGKMAFTVSHGPRRLILVVSDDRTSLSLVTPPEPTAWVAAAGERALAVLPGLRQAWETLNGRDWHAIEIPPRMCPDDSQCPEGLACFDWGCVISSRLTRSRWGAAQSRRFLAIEAPRSAVQAPPTVKVPPLRCTVGPSFGHVLEGVDELLDLDHFAIGQDDWVEVEVDYGSAAAAVVRARQQGQPERVPLLAPVNNPAQYAVASQVTVTGAAAARFTLTKWRADDPSLRTFHAALEAASLAVGSDGTSRARLANVVLKPFNVILEPERGRAALGRMYWLQAEPTGLYLVPNSPWNENGPAFFMSQGKAQALTLPATHRLPVHGMPFLVADGYETVSFYIGDGTLLRSRSADGGFELKVLQVGTIVPPRSSAQKIAFTLHAGRPAVHVHHSDKRGHVRSLVFPLAVQGPVTAEPLLAPTPLGLGAPRPCTKEERASSARIAVPTAPASFPSVTIERPGRTTSRLEVRNVVLYGTPASPCLAALDTEIEYPKTTLGPSSHLFQSSRSMASAPKSISTELTPRAARALIVFADLRHSWLFEHMDLSRAARAKHPVFSRYASGSVVARPMRCEAAH